MQDVNKVADMLWNLLTRASYHGTAPTTEQYNREMTEILEALAELEHDRWSHWMAWQFSKMTPNADGSYTLPAQWAARWMSQRHTHYKDLSETEKESDRREARLTLQLLESLYRAKFGKNSLALFQEN